MKKCANPLTSFDNLSQHINGFHGYEQPGRRERSDRLFREFLVKQTKALLKLLGHKFDAADADYQDRVDENVKSSKRKLLTISESLKNPTYIGALFFTKSNLPENLMSKIYELECHMLEEIKNINDEIKALFLPKIKKDVFEDRFLHIHDFIDYLNQYLFERESLILGDY